jgi:hypothetical protein
MEVNDMYIKAEAQLNNPYYSSTIHSSTHRNRHGLPRIMDSTGLDLWSNGVRHCADGADAEGSCFTVRVIVMSFI